MADRDRRLLARLDAAETHLSDKDSASTADMSQNAVKIVDAPPRPRLVLCDDDRILRDSLAQFLRREGYDVRGVDEPQQALEELQGRPAELLLADLTTPPPTLPPMSGPDWLRRFRRDFPETLVVVMTGYGSIEHAVEMTKAGAFDYLTKPVVDDEIRVVVEKALRQQALIYENRTLRRQLDTRYGLENVVGRDPKMQRIFDLIGAVADSRTTVLIIGESGTGKSLLARSLHHRSPRRGKPFIEVSCGALPEALLESELFGHTKGAFTGAVTDKPGRFMSADGGTIFLDEINSATPAMQVKLLRVLQEKTFEPVGSSSPRTVDVRAVLAANVDLADLVAEGTFRQDLYYRINVVTIHLPPLRERAGDIPMMAEHFLKKHADELKRRLIGFTESAMQHLCRYDWPGNVRELENAIERAAILCRQPKIDVEDLPDTVRFAEHEQRAAAPADGIVIPSSPMPLKDALEEPERRIIEAALARNNWNRQATAAELEINRATLYKKMRRFKLDIGPMQ